MKILVVVLGILATFLMVTPAHASDNPFTVTIVHNRGPQEGGPLNGVTELKIVNNTDHPLDCKVRAVPKYVGAPQYRHERFVPTHIVFWFHGLRDDKWNFTTVCNGFQDEQYVDLNLSPGQWQALAQQKRFYCVNGWSNFKMRASNELSTGSTRYDIKYDGFTKSWVVKGSSGKFIGMDRLATQGNVKITATSVDDNSLSRTWVQAPPVC